tara:strand:+ start:436 stop:651 length:216 start_codon:yes stop_codon:yes gene_type:complete
MDQLTYTIALFLVGVFITFHLKPNLLFTEKGTFRDFGAGYNKKTILPVWLFIIFWAVTSYILIKSCKLFLK